MASAWSASSKFFGNGLYAIPSFYASKSSANIIPSIVHLIENEENVPILFLDIAAGIGTYTSELIQNIQSHDILCSQPKDIFRFLVTDFASGLIDAGRKKFSDDVLLQSYSVDFEVMNAQSLSIPDESYHFLSCQFGIMFVPDKDRAVSEMYRVMKKNGQLILSTWNYSQLADVCEGFGRYYGVLKPDEKLKIDDATEVYIYQHPLDLQNFLEKFGFREVIIKQEVNEFLIANNEELFLGLYHNPALAKVFGKEPSDIVFSRWQQFLQENSEWIVEEGKFMKLNTKANVAIATK